VLKSWKSNIINPQSFIKIPQRDKEVLNKNDII